VFPNVWKIFAGPGDRPDVLASSKERRDCHRSPVCPFTKPYLDSPRSFWSKRWESCAAYTGVTSAPVIRRHYLFAMNKLLAHDESIRDSPALDARGNNSRNTGATNRSSLVNTRASRCIAARVERYACSAWKRDFSAGSTRIEWCQFEQEPSKYLVLRGLDQPRPSRLANEVLEARYEVASLWGNIAR